MKTENGLTQISSDNSRNFLKNEDSTDIPEIIFKPFRIVKNTSMLMIGQVVVQAAAAFIGIFIARTFGDSDYGRYTLAFAYIGIFGILFSMGIDSIVVRETTGTNAERLQVFCAALWLRLAIFPLVVLIIFTVSWIAGYDLLQRQLILMAAFVTGISVIGDLLRSVFQGAQRMELDTLSRGSEKLVAAFLILPFIATLHSIQAVMFALMVGAIAGLVIGWIVLRRLAGRFTLYFDYRQCVRLLKNAGPVGLSMIIIALSAQLPQIMLSFFRPYSEVGLFGAANSISAPFVLLPVAFAGALLPVISSLSRKSDPSLNQVHNTVIVSILAISIPIMILIYYLSDWIIRTLFGQSFASAAEALKVLAFFIPIVFLSTYLANLLIALRAQRFLFLATLLNLILTVAIGLLLIPKTGFMGATFTKVLVPSGGILLMLFFSARWMRYRMSRELLAVTAGTLLAFGSAWVLRYQPLYLRIPSILFIYTAALWVGGFSKTDFFSFKTGTSH